MLCRFTATKFALLGCAVAVLGACASPPEQFAARAHAAGLSRIEVKGTQFTHLIYGNLHSLAVAQDKTAIIFVEGDGVPWTAGGTRPATDPTPRHALALDLLLNTSLPGFYLTRPCYNGMSYEAGCSDELWTGARYSNAVVESMASALERFSNEHHLQRLLLVGYSGGGTVAVLMAPRIKDLLGVVTISANLDTAAWTEIHGYLPLDASLNPATEPAHAGVLEIHLVGERDTNVPPASLTRYFASHPQANIWHYESFDHLCCWADHWKLTLERVLQQVSSTAP